MDPINQCIIWIGTKDNAALMDVRASHSAVRTRNGSDARTTNLANHDHFVIPAISKARLIPAESGKCYSKIGNFHSSSKNPASTTRLPLSSNTA
jgi:hypothetical protein